MAIIYYIDNHKNWKGYVGCSSNTLAKRWGQHKYLLRKGEHPNPQLQEDWNRYGEHSFSAFVIDRCETNEMYDREAYHIKRLGTKDPEIGYNIN